LDNLTTRNMFIDDLYEVCSWWLDSLKCHVYCLQVCLIQELLHTKKQNKQTSSVAFSPQANYTDRATATCRRILVPAFMQRGMLYGQRGGSPMAVNLSFLDQSRYFSFQ
jgi:hypothetical protein